MALGSYSRPALTAGRQERLLKNFQEMLVTGPLNEATELLGGFLSSLSPMYICAQYWSCFKLLRHTIFCACSLARLRAGKSKAARMVMIAITTSSSINVNPHLCPTGELRCGFR